MPSTYTLNNGITLIATGEQSGTWGSTTNVNLELVDTALDGQVTITLVSAGNSGAPNTLPISDGSASNGRNRMVIFDDGGDLGATAYVQLTPNDSEKIIYVRNALSGSRSILLFQGTYNASNDYEVPAGTTAVVYFNGAGTGAVAANVFNNAYFDSLRLGSVSVTAILDEDNMSSDSATALATQQSIKAYVDSQVGTVDTLAEILANGNTTGGTNIVVSSGDAITTNTISETTAASGVTIDSLLVKDGGITAAGTSTFASQTITDLGAVTTADINGGTIDGTVIGGSSAAAGTFTTFTSTGIDDNASSTAVTIDSSQNVGIGTAAPAVPLHISSATPSIRLTDTDDNSDAQIAAAAGGLIVFDADINNEVAGSAILFRVDGGSEKMRIDSSGNVGIGTSSPSTKAEISTNNETSILRLTDTATIGAVDRKVGGIEFYQNDASGGAGIGSSIEAYHVNISGDTDLRFSTGDNTERMRINSSGNVGIGTASPVAKLHSSVSSSGAALAGGVNVAAFVEAATNTSVQISTGTGSSAYINLGDAADIDATRLASQSGFTQLSASGASDYLRFDAGGFVERMRIDSAGHVAVGTTTTGNTSFTIATSSSGVTPNTTGDDLLIESSGNTGMTIASGTTSLGRIYFGDSGSAIAGRISYDHNDDSMFFGTNGTAEDMTIDSSGNVGIGVSNPAVALDVTDGYIRSERVQGGYGNAAGNFHIDSKTGTAGVAYLNWFQGTGGVNVGNGASGYGTIRAAAFTVSSDRRLKENISYFDRGLAEILQLKPATFDFINGENNQKGFIAQDVETVIPEAVGTTTMSDSNGNVDETDTYLTINNSAIIPYLVAAIKEQQTIIESLEARVAALETT